VKPLSLSATPQKPPLSAARRKPPLSAARRKLSLSAARRTLRAALANDTAGVHPLGHAWLRSEVLPAIVALTHAALTHATPTPTTPRAATGTDTTDARADATLLAAAWTLVGEVYELVDAPRAAVAAYTRARRLVPHVPELRALRADAQAAAKSAPRDAVSEAAELLAADRARAALAQLSKLRSARALLARARTYGALGDAAQVIATFAALRNTRGPLRLELADWFYLPDAAFESPALWRALARLVPRLADGSVFVHANGARDAFDPGRAPLSIRVARATWRRVIATQLQRCERLSR